MGKAAKFFKALLGFKTSDATAPPPSRSDPNKQPKRRWSFVKSHRDKPHHHHHLRNSSNSFDGGKVVSARDTLHHHSSDVVIDGNDDPSKHAVAVAAATAAVAEAAVAAAHAAAEVVRLTSRTTGAAAVYGRQEWAAVKIQSHFRAYLARRALRALKGLVKLQALVRGHILRKQTADMMRRLQALIRAQARARAGRSQIPDSSQSGTKGSGSSHFHHYGPPTPEKFEHISRAKSMKYEQLSLLKRNGSKSYARGGAGQERSFLDGPIDDEKNDKILEIDTGKPHTTPRRRNLFQQDQISHSNSYSYSQSLTTSRGSTIQQTGPSPSASCEVNSLTAPLRCCTHDVDEEVSFCTAESSPQFYSVSSKGNSSMRCGTFTPAKSDSSRSCLSGYSDHPNYMAYTESSRAKVRSLSAPRQRPQFEIATSTAKRYSIYGYGSGMQRYSTLRDSFASKAYPGSGRLDRLGMPVGAVGGEGELSSSYYLNRY